MGNLADDWLGHPKRKYYTMPYVKAGETPGWDRCKVVNRATGDAYRDVVECNPREGWMKRNMRTGEGYLITNTDGEAVIETVKGYFEVRIYPE